MLSSAHHTLIHCTTPPYTFSGYCKGFLFRSVVDIHEKQDDLVMYSGRVQLHVSQHLEVVTELSVNEGTGF